MNDELEPSPISKVSSLLRKRGAFPAAAFIMAVGWSLTTQASTVARLDRATEAPLARLAQAWNAGDGAAWGREFWPDANSVNIYGHTLYGGEAMGARHAVVFAGRLKGSKMKMEVLSTMPLGEDVAVVDTIQEVVSPTTAAAPGRDLHVHVAFVLQRRKGAWRIAHVQNTSIVAPPAE